MPFVKVRGDGAITIPVELRRKHSVTPGTWYQLQAKGKSCCPLSARCAPSVVRKFYPLMP